MTDEQNPRTPRRITAVIVGVLAIAIAAVAGVGVLTSGASAPVSSTSPVVDRSTTPPAAASAAPSPTASPTESPTASSTPAPSTTASPRAVPVPQPTRTAVISRPTPVPIKKELSASVVKMEAVTGTADGPGEIGGPSVRFTITIKNTTGKTVVLSNTVVNAYSGEDESPAVQLQSPGGKAFPQSVANGSTATGVFVFNIPAANRSKVKVTVDTSVQNPVIAFQGPAPR